MCNLGQGVFEAGEACGEARGIEKGAAREKSRIIYKRLENGFTLEQIADITEKTIEEIESSAA